ncbi:hypothetical protein EHV15_34250 [Paenibacillus oralis]|uniref:Uncharacterized protein n=1 Tax=Paenibacillus oralis TaxID=2490856 RepID=A0A3P3T9F3_9BACL|nr:hypothetical protein [Paenibacillus oralis]RRJ54661.1 hypothetical protein EHV15_34250 [Paenibacillus oralis]
MENYFCQKVDLRSRAAMVQFLTSHFRYNTMNSWNNSTSYANNVKVNRIIPREHQDQAYNLLEQEAVFHHIHVLFSEWAEQYHYRWHAGFNGRSGGYIVLYQGQAESPKSGPKSYCLECGQHNFKLVPPENPTPEQRLILLVHQNQTWRDAVIYENNEELIKNLGFEREAALAIFAAEKRKISQGAGEFSSSNKCGKCHAPARVNYETPPTRFNIFPVRSTDMGEDFHSEDWDMESLRDRVRLVQSFDQLCDQVRALFIAYCKDYRVEEVEVMVPQKRKILKPVEV